MSLPNICYVCELMQIVYSPGFSLAPRLPPATLKGPQFFHFDMDICLIHWGPLPVRLTFPTGNPLFVLGYYFPLLS